MSELLQLQLSRQMKKKRWEVFTRVNRKKKKTCMKVDTVIGDTAFSEKANIEYTKKEKFSLVSKLNPVISEYNPKEEDKLEYNKDAGRFVCKAWHLAVRKAQAGKRDKVKTKYRRIISILKNVTYAHYAMDATKKGRKVKPIR